MLLSGFSRRLLSKYFFIALVGVSAGITSCSTGGSDADEAVGTEELSDDLAKLETDGGSSSEASILSPASQGLGGADSSQPQDTQKNFDIALDTSSTLQTSVSENQAPSSDQSESVDSAGPMSATESEKAPDSEITKTDLVNNSDRLSPLASDSGLAQESSGEADSTADAAESSPEDKGQAAAGMDQAEISSSGEAAEKSEENVAAVPNAAVTPAPLAGPTSDSDSKRDQIDAQHPAEKPIAYSEDLSEFVYKVKPGDTLFQIAAKVYGKGSLFLQISQKNGLKNPSRLYPGQKLNIDVKGGKDRKFAKDYIKVTWKKSGDYSQVRPDGFATITVKSGLTLSKIAEEIYGDPKFWKKIMAINQRGIKNPNLIFIGQRIHFKVLLGTAETKVSH